MLQNRISQKQIQRRVVKRSLNKSFIYFFLSIPTCNLNMQNLLEIKNMKHIAIISQTLELGFIAPIMSFVPSQRRKKIRKHEQNLNL